MHLHVFFLKCLCQFRHKRIHDLFMNDKRLAGITDTDPLGFGIQNDIYRHVKISRLIHKNMTVSGSCLDHRYRCLIHNCTDQSCSTTWNQNVDILVHFHECCRSIP